MKLAVLSMLCIAFASAAVAQDYQREARWRAEVVPTVVVGEAVDLHMPDGRGFLGLLTASPGARTAIVIVHGIGVHPDHGVIGTLRMALADRGFSTLSIQMPVLAAEAPARDYAVLMPEAAARIGAAAKWLKSRGDADLVLVSHSLGSRMANAYFDVADASAFRGWVALGLGGEFSARFTATRPVAVLDVAGEADLPAVLENAPARRRVAESTAGGRQLSITGADHFYAGHLAELVSAIAEFAGR